MSNEAVDETAFSRASWRGRVVAVESKVDEWEALGKAVSAGASESCHPTPNQCQQQVSGYCRINCTLLMPDWSK